MSQKQSSVWFITGCSTGFGRELARAVVARGFRAVVTARDPKQVTDIVGGHEDRAALAAKIPGDFWHELREQRLVASDAPLPIGR